MIEFLKVAEAAKALRVSRAKVCNWIIEGRLKAINVGLPGKRPQWRIHPEELRNIKPPAEKRRRIIDTHGIDI